MVQENVKTSGAEPASGAAGAWRRAWRQPSHQQVLKAAPSRIIPRGVNSENPDDCLAGAANLCEKPVSSHSLTVPIVLGTTIPLLLVAGLLFYLHRRRSRRIKKEDEDTDKMLDYGMGGGGGSKRGKADSGQGATPHHTPKQLSMDMSLDNPFILGPRGIDRRDSLGTLARSIGKDGSPYAPVEDFTSISSGRSGARANRPKPAKYDVSQHANSPVLPPPRMDSNSRSMNSGADVSAYAHPTNPFDTREASREQSFASMPTPPPPAVMPSSDEAAARRGYPDLRPETAPVPVPQLPYPATTHNSGGLSIPEFLEADAPASQSSAVKAPPLPRIVTDMEKTSGRYGLGIYGERDEPLGDANTPEADSRGLKMAGQIPDGASPGGLTANDEPPQPQYMAYVPGVVKDAETGEQEEEKKEQNLHSPDRRPFRRTSFGDDGQVLRLPATDRARLSVVMRPLPPEEVMETADPEVRAERIRSFYKEYFDESKGLQGAPPMPAGQVGGNEPEYYEDYDAGYLGDTAAFYDPATNAFIMPYAEPVARRAMTPPPRNGAGGSGRPARPHAGSLGGRSLPGGYGPPTAPFMREGYRGRSPRSPRPGPSSAPGSRAGSRVGSRSSSRGPGRRMVPPPAALNTLPAPSKLKDDGTALLGSIDFAPPETYADRRTGTSQSPLGEQRPYQVRLPVASPLVSSREEMSVLPSPHLLRKSSTFTGLDFAPPKKFRDPEQMSDAGSIRSNRTGLSSTSNLALRSGAGRISKLPGDTVFTQSDLSSQLKPQWGMRT